MFQEIRDQCNIGQRDRCWSQYRVKKRKRLRQQAAADRAIAREQRIQEEEQRLLAIAKGEREVAERQAQAKVRQIEQTTNAETEK